MSGPTRCRTAGRQAWTSAVLALAAATVLAGLMGCGQRTVGEVDVSVAPRPAPQSEVARGAYLAKVGNCAGCHTTPGGEDLAGGRALPTPFGTVYAGNLTPDASSGLGRWSADDFWRAMHLGRAPDGRRLVPAFPYTSFTHVSRADSDALYAYLRSVPPVKRPNRSHDLRFPYNTQVALAVWQWLFFTPGRDPSTVPVPEGRSASWARGAYLVRGLGHCAACHAPRNALGAPADALTGGEVAGQAWYAPSLHPPEGHSPSPQAWADLLRVGRTERDSLSGPMAGVVFRSTQHWTAEDLHAMAQYLVSLPARSAAAVAVEHAPAAVMALGRRVYETRCADCHGDQGEGAPDRYPALAGNPTVLQPSARNLVNVLRQGGFAPATAGNPLPYGMPPQDLSNAELAAVASYVRQSWGNGASAVSELQALQWR